MKLKILSQRRRGSRENLERRFRYTRYDQRRAQKERALFQNQDRAILEASQKAKWVLGLFLPPFALLSFFKPFPAIALLLPLSFLSWFVMGKFFGRTETGIKTKLCLTPALSMLGGLVLGLVLKGGLV
jgi:hypothetical protein